jgi:hypothetical protein
MDKGYNEVTDSARLRIIPRLVSSAPRMSIYGTVLRCTPIQIRPSNGKFLDAYNRTSVPVLISIKARYMQSMRPVDFSCIAS